MLLEANVIGYGASGRNGGFGMTMVERNIAQLVRRVGPEQAHAQHLAMVDTLHEIEQFARDEEIDADITIEKRYVEWRIIDNPMGDGDDPILALPAIAPDVALFHATLADRQGNVWIGRRRELATMAHAAATTLVTVEAIHDGDLLETETMAAGVLPALYVSAITVEPRGAWPLALAEHYEIDAEHMAEYMRLAASDEGFEGYLERHVLTAEAA